MFSHMQFQGQWRDYQQRVFDELQGHLEDTRLHIVAAPGSGKTVLGLEVMRELGRPTLILSPTLTIRNQWSERLFEMFLSPEAVDAKDISYDLRAPAAMTSATYQALHALWKVDTEEDEEHRRPNFERLIDSFSAEDGITIIVDEAHHLRREWWRALNALVEALPNATLVALTATPPYDASFAEWSRYDDLCGAIDAEISVPELVRNGDLCPHQDFVHFSIPKQSELDLLEERRRGIATLISDLLSDSAFIEYLKNHPWVVDPELYEEAILGDPEYLSSVLILMAACIDELPKEPLELLGVENKNIPLLSPPWLQIFLNGYLFDYKELSAVSTGLAQQTEKRLRRLGLIENSRVKLMESRAVFKAMAGSLAKLDSIVEIARVEHAHLANDLRMVVLTDYVRAADLPRVFDQPFKPAKLGVVPIFETLRRARLKEDRIGVLTGTLVILPESACSKLTVAAKKVNIPESQIKLKALVGCPGYFELRIEGKSNQNIVQLVTELFNLGAIRILIGTQALLGEGWDAPTINTLVLASNVGSYMLSNQMRGRAIRIDRDAPDKVANIWHLATVEPQSSKLWPYSAARFVWNEPSRSSKFELEKLGSDMQLLSQRFEMFEGISNGISDHISNGIDRLDISGQDWNVEDIAGNNKNMVACARQRSENAQKWTRSLGDAAQRTHVHKIAEVNYAPRAGSYDQTLQYLSISAVLGGLTSAAGALRQFQSIKELATIAMVFGGLTLLYSLPKLFIATRLFIRNGTLERSLNQVGDVLLESLSHIDALKNNPSTYKIEIEPSLRGRHNIILHNASRAEERIFLDALSEILGPIENPRYFLVRKSFFGIIVRKDFHAVPSILAMNKDNAEYFSRRWNKHIGPVKLIFSRQKTGRKLLLQARSRSMAAGFQRFVDRRSQWR